MKKIRNTKDLVRQRKEHLIPGLVKQFPDQYLTIEKYNKLNIIRPWVESSKPRRNRIPGGMKTMAPVRDRVLVLYVDFPDKAAQVPTSAIYDRFFSPEGNTFKNFYAENSYNKYVPDGEVHGPYRLPQNLAYYVNDSSGMGNYPNNAQRMVEDAISIAANDLSINWGSFDNSGNSEIDLLIIVHAGAEAAYTGSTSDMWAHVSSISPILRNGYGFQYYATVSEYMGWASDAQRTGTDSHEFGHLLGLPDLYDYSGNSNGAGYFSLMASGSWADNGSTPVHLDAWSKFFCDFTNTMLNQSGLLAIDNAETYDKNYLINSQYPYEYFMVENRQNIGFDLYLPANGILIWRVNTLHQTNDNELCFKVGLIQADGLMHLENSVNTGDPGDSFPGNTGNRSLSMTTIPSTVLCNGLYPNFEIRNITDSANSMSFILETYTPCINPECGIIISQ